MFCAEEGSAEKGAAMWLCVDRMESDTVILVSDEEQVFRLSGAEYLRLTGRAPVESDILRAEVKGGCILSAAPDDSETAARKEAAAARLKRLFGGE